MVRKICETVGFHGIEGMEHLRDNTESDKNYTLHLRNKVITKQPTLLDKKNQ